MIVSNIAVMNNNGSKICGQGEAIVSYIYNEMSAVDRHSFESHVAVCDACTSDLGAVSDARLAVHEWWKEDFELLQTPEIVIPYSPAKSERKTAVSGWLASIFAGFVEMGRSPLTVASVLLLCFGLAFTVFYFMTGDGGEIASNSSLRQPSDRDLANFQSPVESLSAAKSTESESANGETEESLGDKVNSGVEARPAARIGVAKGTRRTSGKSTIRKKRDQIEQEMREAPVLSDYREIEDESLRLADLLEMVGG